MIYCRMSYRGHNEERKTARKSDGDAIFHQTSRRQGLRTTSAQKVIATALPILYRSRKNTWHVPSYPNSAHSTISSTSCSSSLRCARRWDAFTLRSSSLFGFRSFRQII